MESYRLKPFIDLFNEYVKDDMDNPDNEKKIECKLYEMLLSEDYYFNKQIDELSSFVDKYCRYMIDELDESEIDTSSIKEELRNMLANNNNLEIAIKDIFSDVFVE
jgi:hypothetical protein